MLPRRSPVGLKMVLKMPHWTCSWLAPDPQPCYGGRHTFIRSTILERGTAIVNVDDAPVLVQSLPNSRAHEARLRPSRSPSRNKVSLKRASARLSAMFFKVNITFFEHIQYIHPGSSPRCWLIEAALRRVVSYNYHQHEQAAGARAARLCFQKAQGLASKGPSSQRTAFTAETQDRSPYTRSCEEGSRLRSCCAPTPATNWDQSGCGSIHTVHSSQKPPATARDHRPEAR